MRLQLRREAQTGYQLVAREPCLSYQPPNPLFAKGVHDLI
jgi:hypothetical protein